MTLPPLSPDAMIVAAVLLGGFGIVGALSARAEGRWPLAGLVLIGLAGFFGWRAWDLTGGLAPADIPTAFIHVIAALLR